MILTLRRPDLADTERLLAFKKEWLENDHSEWMNGASGLNTFENINDWFKKINHHASASIEELQKENRVPQITYIALWGDRVVGIFSLRPFPTEEMYENGTGNIGYCVSPLLRGKGIGTEMLHQALPILKTFGLRRASVGCFKENIASTKVIMNNGGILDREWVDHDGKNCLRFHIDL